MDTIKTVKIWTTKKYSFFLRNLKARFHSKNIYHDLFHWKDFRLKIFIEGTIIGFFAGVLIVLFRYALELIENLRNYLYLVMAASDSAYRLLWLTLLCLIGLILGLLIKKEPMARGSGIPEVEGILAGHLKMKWHRVIAAKFIGGVLAIGAGLSLGREGPSIQLGAAVGQGISRLLGRFRIEEKYLITSGASAGLAAAFNAPLAGVIFALEEIHKTFSPAILMSSVAASLTADFVSQQVFGVKPIFDFSSLPILPFSYYAYVIGLGIVTGLFAVIFNKSLIRVLNAYDAVPVFMKNFVPAIPLIIGGILGFFLPQVLGGGNELIMSLRQSNYSLYLLAVLLIVKFIFTMISYGSGVPGGIFLPLLVIGALTGDIYGHLMITYFHIEPLYITNFLVLSMAAYFAGIVKAPITGSILITEMTGSFHHLFSLIAISMTAYIITDLLNSKPVYEELLQRRLAGNKVKANIQTKQGRKTVIEVNIDLASQVDGKKIKNISWPANSLIVGIRRGDAEIIPNGDTIINSKDIIYALVDERYIAKVKTEFRALAGENF
jgi:H+/Cl- antiporter ClcA